MSIGSARMFGRMPTQSNRVFLDALALKYAEHPVFVWLALGALFSTGAYLAYEITSKRVYLETCIPLAIGIAFTPLGIRFGYSIVCEWANLIAYFVRGSQFDSLAWIENDLAPVRSAPSKQLPYLFASGFAVFAFAIGGTFETLTTIERVALIAFIALAGTVALFGISAVVCLSAAISRLGIYPVVVEPHEYGILSTGAMLAKCYSLAAFGWCAFAASAVASTHPNVAALLCLAVPSFLFFVISFVVCQGPLHKQMVRFKRERIFAIQAQLESLLPPVASELTEQRRKRIEFLESRMAQAVSLPDWPFTVRPFLTTVISACAASLPPFVELFSLMSK